MEINMKKVHTSKDITISSIILVAGIGLAFVNVGLGCLIGAAGALMLILYKSGYRIEGENTVLYKEAQDIAKTCKSSLKDFLDGKNTEPIVDTQQEGGVIRIEMYYNTKDAIAYVQLFDFIDFAYVPSTDVVELRGTRALKLIEKF